MTARHVILDADFGDGGQFLAAWAAWPGDGRALHYLAIAPQPPGAAQIASAQLRELWPPLVPGFHRILLDDGRVTLDLMIGAPDAVLAQIDARVDAFHLPKLVRPSARALARLAEQGATLLAHAPSEEYVWDLTRAGFACKAVADSAGISAVYSGHQPQRPARSDRRPGAPAAAARVEPPPVENALRVGLPSGADATCIDVPSAANATRIDPPSAEYPVHSAHADPHSAADATGSDAPRPDRRAIVIGAGMAGAAACERLCAHGWDVTLIERHAQPAQEASGNLAGIFMPLLSKDDNIPTRLSRAAFLFALRYWQRLGGVGAAFSGARCGVLQLARDAAHAQVQQDVIATWNYPPDYARWLNAADAGLLLGRATPHGGWLFEQGGWIYPASLCAAMLSACGPRLRRIFSAEALTLERVDEQWQVRAADGALIAQAPTLILANGTGARALAQAAELPLSALRGQVTHLAAGSVPSLPLVVCREAYVTPAIDGIVSAGATYDNDDGPALRAASQLENLARLAEILDGVDGDVRAAPLAGRVGFRCAAPDRLPLAGALPDYPNAGRLERLRDVPRHPGLHGLLGYASRGLIWAPLMAELLVSQLDGAPPPLEASLAAALDPGRFLLKQRRREQ